MKYINAADVLPENLLREISKYVKGELLYIPITEKKYSWGEKNGTKTFFQKRNHQIYHLYQEGKSLDLLAESFHLSKESIRKIIRNTEKKESFQIADK